ncbi:hypothetical protein STCU_11175 [Strigomonas culicis]|uniref:Uncharacterized protein n=1 Tax=Strigomonas culicis TaxID=28005 RepID=S9TJI6_9TRYP|nr:hypothetical protein STCU_11175 [Strigomonas culicis]|eukprot:EPY16523.1 hypothetical protein STCU_11175 [Strigomonas culicis]
MREEPAQDKVVGDQHAQEKHKVRAVDEQTEAEAHRRQQQRHAVRRGRSARPRAAVIQVLIGGAAVPAGGGGEGCEPPRGALRRIRVRRCARAVRRRGAAPLEKVAAVGASEQRHQPPQPQHCREGGEEEAEPRPVVQKPFDLAVRKIDLVAVGGHPPRKQRHRLSEVRREQKVVFPRVVDEVLIDPPNVEKEGEGAEQILEGAQPRRLHIGHLLHIRRSAHSHTRGAVRGLGRHV